MSVLQIGLLVCGIPWVRCRESVAFDDASASSSYASVSFGAAEAISPGGRYWCSSGGHLPHQVVTWSGLLDARVSAIGFYMNWAYSPGESKILCSADGANFEEAQPWRHTSRSDASFGQYFMFSASRAVRAVTVALRAPRAWGYFGLRQAWLVARQGSFMIVSGMTSPSDLCLIAPGEASAAKTLTTKSCSSAIAAADGAEIFEFDVAGQLVHALRRSCVAEPEAALRGQSVELQRCPTGGAGAGQLMWRLQSTGRLEAVGAGGRCLRLRGASFDGAEAPELRQCADGDADGRDVFFLVGVPEMSPGVASGARGSAVMLAAASKRLTALVSELHLSLQSCTRASLSLCQRVRATGRRMRSNRTSWDGAPMPVCHRAMEFTKTLLSADLTRRATNAHRDEITDAPRGIEAELRVDMVGVQGLIAQASRLIDECKSLKFLSEPLANLSAFVAAVAAEVAVAS